MYKANIVYVATATKTKEDLITSPSVRINTSKPVQHDGLCELGSKLPSVEARRSKAAYILSRALILNKNGFRFNGADRVIRFGKVIENGLGEAVKSVFDVRNNVEPDDVKKEYESKLTISTEAPPESKTMTVKSASLKNVALQQPISNAKSRPTPSTNGGGGTIKDSFIVTSRPIDTESPAAHDDQQVPQSERTDQ